MKPNISGFPQVNPNTQIFKSELQRLREANAILLAALEALIAASNCNYETSTMAYAGLFTQACAAVTEAKRAL